MMKEYVQTSHPLPPRYPDDIEDPAKQQILWSNKLEDATNSIKSESEHICLIPTWHGALA
jgi:hypothetical protein